MFLSLVCMHMCDGVGLSFDCFILVRLFLGSLSLCLFKVILILPNFFSATVTCLSQLNLFDLFVLAVLFECIDILR